ncbi:class I SAM-dependent methyltransferase [Candidatus Woesearchaeota archaeon]|nr:class I SAM-dependent methyltransferase [Candidatus Woesearchaeota archaeon]
MKTWVKKRLLNRHKCQIINNSLICTTFLTNPMKKEVKISHKYLKTCKKNIQELYERESLNPNIEMLLDFIKRLKKEKILKKKSNILELGGGMGWFSTQLATNSDHVVFTDITQGHLTIAKQYQKLKNVNFETSLIPMQNINSVFKENSFDLVFVSAALHHCSNLKEVYKNVAKVLKSKGKFFVLCEPMVGLFYKNKEIEHVANKGAQDVPYTIRNYLKASNDFFDYELEVSKTVLYYKKNINKIRSSKILKKLFILSNKILTEKSINNFFFKKVYFTFAYFFGRVPVNIILTKKT